MRKSCFLKILIGILLFLSINSYDLDDILDAATRVKNYVLKYYEIPKIVRVASDELSIAKFTYAMGVAIQNIHSNKKEAKIQAKNVDSPSTPYRCNIKVMLEDYIDAIDRVLKFCDNNGAAPAYVLSSSVKIGYREYVFGFSKILDFYRNKKELPLYNNFNSSEMDPISDSKPDTTPSGGVIQGVTIKKGINEKNQETNIEKYKTGKNEHCKIDSSIKNLAQKLTSGKNTILQKATSIFDYVKRNIKYDYYMNSVRGSVNTLLRGRGNCCDQSNLLVALCRASGIPIKYAQGQNCVFRSGLVSGHIWTQILIGNMWYVADPVSSDNKIGFIVNWNINKFHSLRQFDLLPF